MGARKDPRMSADDEECGPLADAARCTCREAVTRAYRGMLDCGVPDSVALDAAIRVYRYHHPEATRDHAHLTVETWVFTGRLH